MTRIEKTENVTSWQGYKVASVLIHSYHTVTEHPWKTSFFKLAIHFLGEDPANLPSSTLTLTPAIPGNHFIPTLETRAIDRAQ